MIKDELGKFGFDINPGIWLSDANVIHGETASHPYNRTK